MELLNNYLTSIPNHLVVICSRLQCSFTYGAFCLVIRRLSPNSKIVFSLLAEKSMVGFASPLFLGAQTCMHILAEFWLVLVDSATKIAQ